MSDRGDEDNGRHSRNGSMSGHSDDDKRIVTYKSRSKEPSKSASTSPSKLKYRSRSRSRSHHRSRRSRSHRRSRSRSFHRYRSRYSRSFTHSRSGSYSPYRGSSRRRRHTGTRGSHEIKNLMPVDKKSNANYENPKQNKCLGVFGLSIYTTENQLHHIFSKFGGVNKVQVVIDAKSGRSRGFAFVYFDSIEDAKNAKDNCTGMEIDGRKIRVDFSITQRAHTPTPGIYMGKPTYSSDVRWRDDDYYGGGGGGGSRSSRYDRYRRSPSPYYSRRRSRYDRSRSRSYSPRVVRRGYG